MSDPALGRPSRRDLLSLIGAVAGGSAMYQAMSSLGFAAESPYRGPIRLEGDPKGASVLVLGAGLAGMTAAFELRRAGYKVQILEYNSRPGGRNWTLRGGDVYVELGGAMQRCAFDDGLYLNPGPWRIPYHHHAILDYCRRFGVALEPFIQLNHNAFLHATTAFGGKPQRIREIKADFDGATAELLAKATRQGALDQAVSKEDQEILLEALRAHGALDDDFRYKAGDIASAFRGYARDPGGGLDAEPVDSEPIGLHDLLTSRLWRSLQNFSLYDFQTTMFQPVGGMGRIGEAFARQIPNVIRYGAKVMEIHQDENGVAVVFEALDRGAGVEEARADWCVCALPLSILSQLDIDVSAPMKAAIDAVPYASVVKTGLQFKRRFWEEDERIFGGVSYTNLPIRQIAYPSGRPQCRRQGRAARRLHLGRPECLRADRDVAGRSNRGGARPAALRSIRNIEPSSKPAYRSLGIACPSPSVARANGRMRRAAITTTIFARSTAGSFWRASTPPTSRPGRRARSCRRSTRSRRLHKRILATRWARSASS